jgi:hypothetical protein
MIGACGLYNSGGSAIVVVDGAIVARGPALLDLILVGGCVVA